MEKQYIEREKAREFIGNYGKNAIDLGRWSLDPVDDIICLAKGVEKIPSADVVEVVRCKNCIYRSQYPDEQGDYKCGASITDDGFWLVSPDHFCSDGKRKDK